MAEGRAAVVERDFADAAIEDNGCLGDQRLIRHPALQDRRAVEREGICRTGEDDGRHTGEEHLVVDRQRCAGIDRPGSEIIATGNGEYVAPVRSLRYQDLWGHRRAHR